MYKNRMMKNVKIVFKSWEVLRRVFERWEVLRMRKG
jgi:hypothetical protein